MRPVGSVGEVRQRMFREPGSEVKGGWLRWVDTAEGGRKEVMDWEQRVGREGRASEAIYNTLSKDIKYEEEASSAI